jgi:hypothetical protein
VFANVQSRRETPEAAERFLKLSHLKPIDRHLQLARLTPDECTQPYKPFVSWRLSRNLPGKIGDCRRQNALFDFSQALPESI